MANAIIKFDQGASHPPAGQALEGVTGLVVACTNGDNAGILTWLWQLIDVPPGSSLSTGTISTTSSASFTPDAPGGYQVRLTTVDGASNTYVDNRAVLVPEDTIYERIIAPFSATADALNVGGQTRGWAPFMEDYLHVIDRIGDWSSSAASAGNSIVWDSVSKFWKPITMAALTAALVVASFPPGSNGQILTTTAGVTGWAAAPTSGINQLTGDVTAGPGSGSQAATVAKIQGVTISGTPSAGQSIIASGSAAAAWGTVPTTGITSGTAGQIFVTNATPASAWTSLISYETTHGRLKAGGSGSDFSAVIGPDPGFETLAANLHLLANGVSASSSNFAIQADGANVTFNAVGGTGLLNFSAANAVQMHVASGALSLVFDMLTAIQVAGSSLAVKDNGSVTRDSYELVHGRFTAGGGGSDCKAVIGPLVGGETTNAALWLLPNATAATGTNYAVNVDGSNTIVNTISGGVYFYQSGTAQMAAVLPSDGLRLALPNIHWLASQVPLLSQDIAASDVATQNLTISAQGPYASAVTHVDAGLVIVNTPASISGALYGGGLRVDYNGFPQIQLGTYSSGSFGAIWFAGLNGGNFGFLGSASTTQLNAPSGGALYFEIGGTPWAHTDGATLVMGPYLSETYSFNLTSTTSPSMLGGTGATSLKIGTNKASATLILTSGANSTTLTLDVANTQIVTTVANLTWTDGAGGPIIGQTTGAGDGHDFQVAAQNGASGHVGGRLLLNAGTGGSSSVGGDILLSSGIGGASSTAGSVHIQAGSQDVLLIDVVGTGTQWRTTSVGSWLYNHVSKAANYTINSSGNNDYMITCTAALTLTMPAPAQGMVFIVNADFSLGAASLTFARHASEKINGTAASLVINNANSSFKPLVVTSNGTDWFVMFDV